MTRQTHGQRVAQSAACLTSDWVGISTASVRLPLTTLAKLSKSISAVVCIKLFDCHLSGCGGFIRPNAENCLGFPSPLDRWRSGAVVRASDFGPRGPWFEPRPVQISFWP